MPQLRWTLLGLGVLFIILLVWIERRRQRRTFSDTGPVEKEFGGADSDDSTFGEHSLTLPEMRARDPHPPQELPVVEIEEDSLTARRVEPDEASPEPPTLSLPVMSAGPVARLDLAESDRFAKPVGDMPWDASVQDMTVGDVPIRDMRVGDVPRLDIPARAEPGHGKFELSSSMLARANRADSEERSFNDSVFGDTEAAAGPSPVIEIEAEYTAATGGTFGTAADTSEEFSSGDTEAQASAPAAQEPRFTAEDIAPVPEPIVDWPPDDQRHIIALRLVAPPTERIAGRRLRLALASEGFVLGKFSIFHKPDASGRAVLSAASLSKPGTFDIATMDVARYGGVSLFAVLPGPQPALQAFEGLLASARNLNERLHGALQDERGGPLTPSRISSLREALSAAAP